MFTQDGFGVRLEWGRDGLTAIAPHCTVVIIVDVLSFSTSVDLIVGQHARVRVAPWTGDGPPRPSALKSVQAGAEYTVSSPNGCELAIQAAKTTRVMTGCLRNANAVADKAIDVADRGPIGVVAAGEQWGINVEEHVTPGRLRPAIEDYLGAGAIISALLAEGYNPASPEAAFAASSYKTAEPYLAELLGGCGSGLELGARGRSEDIAIAGQVNVSKAAPLLTDGVFQ